MTTEAERRQLLCRRSGCFCPPEEDATPVDLRPPQKVKSVTILGDPNQALEIAGVDLIGGCLYVYCHPLGEVGK